MSTLIQDYELLVRYLEEMIDDGCQLVHGGNLFDWSDTKITNILVNDRLNGASRDRRNGAISKGPKTISNRPFKLVFFTSLF